jgi:hypothetical protein
MLVAEVVLGGQRWAHFCCCQPPASDPIVNPFHWTLASPLHAVRAPALPCKPILPSVQMIIVGGASMLHGPGYGLGGGVEVVCGWVAVSLIRAPNDFCLSNTQPHLALTSTPPTGPPWTRPGQPTVVSQVFRHG